MYTYKNWKEITADQVQRETKKYEILPTDWNILPNNSPLQNHNKPAEVKQVFLRIVPNVWAVEKKERYV